jgi:hypothetical protein
MWSLKNHFDAKGANQKSSDDTPEQAAEKGNSGTSEAKASSETDPLTQRWKRCSTQSRHLKGVP